MKATLVQDVRINNEQLQPMPTSPMQNLVEVQDLVLQCWCLGRGAQKKERIKEALDCFIEGLEQAARAGT